jgi:thymidine phosphorylase
VQTGHAASHDAALRRAEDCLASGKPRLKWDEMIEAQGGDLEAFHRKLALDHTAPAVAELKAAREGFVSRCDARILGEVIRDLGGGRLAKESSINHDVGVDKLAKPGAAARLDSVLARVHANDPGQCAAAIERLKAAWTVSAEPPNSVPPIAEVLSPKHLCCNTIDQASNPS